MLCSINVWCILLCLPTHLSDDILIIVVQITNFCDWFCTGDYHELSRNAQKKLKPLVGSQSSNLFIGRSIAGIGRFHVTWALPFVKCSVDVTNAKARDSTAIKNVLLDITDLNKGPMGHIAHMRKQFKSVNI